MHTCVAVELKKSAAFNNFWLKLLKFDSILRCIYEVSKCYCALILLVTQSISNLIVLIQVTRASEKGIPPHGCHWSAENFRSRGALLISIGWVLASVFQSKSSDFTLHSFKHSITHIKKDIALKYAHLKSITHIFWFLLNALPSFLSFIICGFLEMTVMVEAFAQNLTSEEEQKVKELSEAVAHIVQARCCSSVYWRLNN